MVQQTILRSDMMKAVDDGTPFDMVFVTADRKRGTGGELIRVKNWVKKIGDPVAVKTPRAKPVNQSTAKPPTQGYKTVVILNPRHRRQHPITVHWKLVQFFNNKRVLNG